MSFTFHIKSLDRVCVWDPVCFRSLIVFTARVIDCDVNHLEMSYHKQKWQHVGHRPQGGPTPLATDKCVGFKIIHELDKWNQDQKGCWSWKKSMLTFWVQQLISLLYKWDLFFQKSVQTCFYNARFWCIMKLKIAVTNPSNNTSKWTMWRAPHRFEMLKGQELR